MAVDRCFTDRNFNVPSTVVALTHQIYQFAEAESVKILVIFLGCSQPLDLLMKTIFITTGRYMSNDETLSPVSGLKRNPWELSMFPDKSVYTT